jgi:integrase
MEAEFVCSDQSSPEYGKKRRVGLSKKSRVDAAELAAAGYKRVGTYVGWREPNDPKKKKSYRHYKRYEEARAFRTELDRQLATGTYVPRATREERIDDFVARMLKSDHHLAPSTLSGYHDTYENHVRAKLGHRPIGDVSTRELQDFVDRLIEDGVGNGTLTAVRQFLAKVFNQAVEEGVVSKAPTRSLRLPKDRKKKLSRETLRGWADAMQPLAATIEARYRLALYLAGVLGLRAGEIGGLRVQDIDFATNTITVRQAIRTVDGRPEVAETKTSAGERTISVPRPIMEEVAAYTKEYQPADDGRIFTAVQGGPVSHLTLNKALQKAIQETGSPAMRFHDLRHLAASTMIAVGIGPSVVKERLGHSTLAITMDRYSHLFPEQDRDAADRLEGHIQARGLMSSVQALPAAEEAAS